MFRIHVASANLLTFSRYVSIDSEVILMLLFLYVTRVSGGVEFFHISIEIPIVQL
jgi:hypothetical protein